MSDNKAVYSLTICGQATIDMHSLNNEGSEGKPDCNPNGQRLR